MNVSKELITFEGIHDLEIAYDTTDHFNLICPRCKKECRIISVKTIKNLQIDFEGTKDSCTYIKAYCRECKIEGQRKIYWNAEKHMGRSSRGRTNWKEEYLKYLKEKK